VPLLGIALGAVPAGAKATITVGNYLTAEATTTQKICPATAAATKPPAPGTPIYDANYFTLVSSTGTDVVSKVELFFNYPMTGAGTVYITDDSNSILGQANVPAGGVGFFYVPLDHTLTVPTTVT